MNQGGAVWRVPTMTAGFWEAKRRVGAASPAEVVARPICQKSQAEFAVSWHRLSNRTANLGVRPETS